MITSLLDNDFYAFTMGNAIHAAGDQDLPVRYEFRNRTFAVPLARRLILDEIREHINMIREFSFLPSELIYLRDMNLFSYEYLDSLSRLTLPEVEVGQDNGHLILRYEGPWSQAIHWESILLALINELYYSRFGDYLSEGEQRLAEKIDYLEERRTLRFAEFGTRRRFSSDWQHYVTHTIQQRIPKLMVGTSNVGLAKELGLTPVGTMAHQLFMVYTARHMVENSPTEDAIATGTNAVLQMWLDAYGEKSGMLTVLPDTYTTDAFAARVDLNLLSMFGAFRQDSGDPIAVGHKLLALGNLIGYGKPRIMFSDSLDIRKMSVIEDYFDDNIDMVCGWGTDLTNDLGYEPLSIVIKPSAVQVNGEWVPCAKLSDDPQKVTGEDAELYRRMVNA